MENYMTSETREKPMTKTRSLVYCALFTALIAVGAFIKIPIPVVPFTLQYLFTMLAGILLGSRLGSLSVLAYMILEESAMCSNQVLAILLVFALELL